MSINKLSIKNLIEYRRLTNRGKQGFANRLKRPVKSKEGGGDYWIRSVSAISTAFRDNDNSIVSERLEQLQNDYSRTEVRKTKMQYQRNIEIMSNFIGFDFSTLRPVINMEFLSRPRSHSLLSIKGLPVQVLPHHVFTFGSKDNKQIGSIWFITWKEGFKSGDLGIFSEALFRYLTQHYSNEYKINPMACKAVDIATKRSVSYDQIQSGAILPLLDVTLDDLKGKIR